MRSIPQSTPRAISLDDARRDPRAAMTRTEVAALLGINPRTVTEGIKTGVIPCVRVGRRVLIPREPFLAMLSAPERQAN